MMKKLLSSMFKNFENKEWGMHGMWYMDGSSFKTEVFFMKSEKYMKINNHKLYLDCFPLVNMMMTAMMFMVLWKYDMKLLPNEFMENYIYFLYFYFFFMVAKLLMFLMKSMYMYMKFEDNSGMLLFLSVMVTYMNFMMNVKMMMYVLNLSFSVFLQYNMLLVMMTMNAIMLNMHKWYLNIEFKGPKLTNFVSYPWMMMVMVYMCYYFNMQNGYKMADLMFEYCSWYVNMKISKEKMKK